MEQNASSSLIQVIQDMEKKWPVITKNAIVDVLSVIVRRLEGDVKEVTPVGVGKAGGLRGSIHGEVKKMGSQIVGVVGTPLEYGVVVEYGRSAGKFPPVNALIPWVKRKLGVSASQAESVATAVAWKIFHKGTDPQKMFSKTFDKDRQWIDKMLNTIPALILKRINTK